MRQSGEPITAELESVVVEQYRSGIGGCEIAAESGISKCVVYRILKRNSVPTRRDFSRVGKDHRLFDDDTEKKIGEEYLRGAALNAIAKKYQSNLVTIRNVLARRGIKRRRRGGSFKELSAKQKKQIVDLWDAGKSQRSIADEIGICDSIVARVIVKQGRKLEKRNSGSNSGGWKGGRVEWQGYIGLYLEPKDPYYSMVNSCGYVFEHRLAMARHIGRPLREDESVHHINGDKQDNRIENLQLMHWGHPKGVAFCCGDCGSINVLPVPLKTKKELN